MISFICKINLLKHLIYFFGKARIYLLYYFIICRLAIFIGIYRHIKIVIIII